MFSPLGGRKAMQHPLTFLMPFTLVLLLFLAPMAVYSAALPTVFVNGSRVSSYPVIRDGVSYLPIQVMAQALQAEIVWDSKLNIVKVNGEPSAASVYSNDGKVYLPIEAFVTALGGSVSYNGRENIIKVQTSGAPAATTRPATTTNTVPVAKPVISYGKNATVPVSVPIQQGKGSASAPTSYGSNATGYGSNATGYGSNATGYGSNATGYGSNATGYGSNATGYGSNATGYGSNATGYGSNATGYGSNATGYGSNATGYGSNATGYGSNATGYGSNATQATNIRPADAPPYLGENLTPTPAAKAGVSGGAGYTPLPANAQRPVDGVYVPRSAQNSVFQVTVTNLETVSVLKDFYRPRAGYKYVIAYLSQQNVSEQVQIYTGRFSLLDQKANSYEYNEGLSNFWLVILRPFGVNFGYLVFEVPIDSKPISLILHALNQAPLTVNL